MGLPGAAVRRGYTLLQMIVAVGILSALMAAAVKSYAIAHSGAMASMCAARLKTLAMELERYRADCHSYPAMLDELYPDYVQSESAFRCPEERRPDVRTYSDFYIVRSPADKSETRLLLSCPFHQDSGRGVEVFLNNPSHHVRGKTYVAILSSGGSTQVLRYDDPRPADAEPTDPSFWEQAKAAVPDMEVGPGDWILVPAGGEATLTFRDGSTAQIAGPSQVMVVDAFQYAAGRGEMSPFHAVLRLASGYVHNLVTPGSRYEVITPTGTAGAKGTEFWVCYVKAPSDGPPVRPPKGKGRWKKRPKGKATLGVATGCVYLTGRFGTIECYSGEVADVAEDGHPKKRGNRP